MGPGYGLTRASIFGDMHHIAGKSLTNIFVNIFYIGYEENRGRFPPGNYIHWCGRLSLHQDEVTRWRPEFFR